MNFNFPHYSLASYELLKKYYNQIYKLFAILHSIINNKIFFTIVQRPIRRTFNE